MRCLLLLVLIVQLASAEEVRRLREPLRVTESVDLSGVVFVGSEEGTPADGYEGVGLLLEGVRGITIRGARLRGFRCAILMRNCVEVTLEDCDLSDNFRQHLRSTPEREDPSDWLWPHENDAQEWRKNYGAGICLEQCRDCVVRRCTARRQQNGILLDRSTGCTIEACDASFNSGWGIALWRSSRNVIRGNRFDWCVRGYSHGVYDRGQDSAGILVFEQCCENLFLHNSATHGGDGFFLYAGHETTQRTGKGGCNDNLVVGNDFSHAVANAIEATFSTRNTFEQNRCDDSNYGIWGGYSYGSSFNWNTCRDNTIAGIAIEHGGVNVMHGNVIEGSPRGIHLWWDDDKDLLASAFGKAHSCASAGFDIGWNRIEKCSAALVLRQTTGVVLSGMEEAGVDTDADSTWTRGDQQPIPPLPSDGTLPASPTLRGRRFILIDEWGPVDPASRAVFPREVNAWGPCSFHVLGAEEGYEVRGLPEGTRVEKSGRTFRVRGSGAGMHAFAGEVVIGKERFPFRGMTLEAKWNVRWWKFAEDPREEGAWGRIVATAPLAEREAESLDFAWKHGAPDPQLPADGFATRAETRLALPVGRYELRTLSDDGIRVLLDGKVVQEDWTWHGPTEHKTVLEIGAGEHDLVVEHFELDGYAALSLSLLPLR